MGTSYCIFIFSAFGIMVATKQTTHHTEGETMLIQFVGTLIVATVVNYLFIREWMN